MGTDEQLNVLARIITLETRLSSTIEKLDQLIDSVEAKYQTIDRIYSGDNSTPSLMSRVIQLEEFRKGIWWALGVLYTAVIGVIVSLIARKL